MLGLSHFADVGLIAVKTWPADGSSEESISISVVADFKDPLAIVSNVNQTLKDNKNELDRLNKIKQGLMQDLLTGKVRVNNLLKKEVTA